MGKTMSPSGITAGQIGKFQELLAARLRKSELSSEFVQQTLESHGDAIADEMVMAVRRRVEATMLLAPRGTATVTLTERHDPNRFYQNRKGLWVWDDFRSRIVANAKPSDAGVTWEIKSAELMRGMTNTAIEAGLSASHLFDETQVCAIIAGLIVKQPEGQEGTLLNNGYANLFYTSSCVVLVFWYADDRGWRVCAWGRDDRGWDAGNQVFCPATDA